MKDDVKFFPLPEPTSVRCRDTDDGPMDIVVSPTTTENCKSGVSTEPDRLVNPSKRTV